jgi:3-phenylpropionate/trans-cinnamate dioxygenase ferredoxin subunit
MSAMTDFITVAKVDEVPAGKKVVRDLNGRSILVCHTQDGHFYVVENKCSHAYECLDRGRMKAGWISCPIHGAKFDLATGKALALPATAPIVTFEVRVTDGNIEVKS